MKRPVVGIIGSMHLVENRFPAQRVGERNLRAVKDVVGALPLVFAGSPEITDIHLIPDGVFARIFGSQTVRVNSLHGQGILAPGKRVVVEGTADDGTIEAISIEGAKGFALGAQWHAEYDPQNNPVNRALFEAFGAAVRLHRRA